MIYLMSDLHGAFDPYQAMLRKIHLAHEDLLFVLGDVVDRGPRPVEILLDMLQRENVFPLLGNHELAFLQCVERLPLDCTLDNFMLFLKGDGLGDLSLWMLNGGRSTFEGYLAQPPAVREALVEYVRDFSLYEELQLGDRRYLLTHSGLRNFSPEKALEDYALEDFLWDRPEPGRTYDPGRTLIFGHTPTLQFPGWEGRILHAPTFLDLDCGCGFLDQGGRLGCLRLEDGAEFYVE